MDIIDVLPCIIKIFQVVCYAINFKGEIIKPRKIKCNRIISFKLTLNKCLVDIKSDFTNIFNRYDRNGVVLEKPFVAIPDRVLCKICPTRIQSLSLSVLSAYFVYACEEVHTRYLKPAFALCPCFNLVYMRICFICFSPFNGST